MRNSTALRRARNTIRPLPKLDHERVIALRNVARRQAEANGIFKLERCQGEPTPGSLTVLNDQNELLTVQRFKVWPQRQENLTDWNCSVSVVLYLRFLREGAGLFFILFLLSTAAMADNVRRNGIRAACREVAASETGYRVLTRMNLTHGLGGEGVTEVEVNLTRDALGFEPRFCGWEGLRIRRFNSSTVTRTYQPNNAYQLRTSKGGCQEYLDGDSRGLLPQGPGSPPIVVETPTAGYCLSNVGWSYLSQCMQLLGTCLTLVFLVRLRWLTQKTARLEDEETFTTADYAVLLSGLDTSLDADELRAKLAADLASIDNGSFAGKIHHIELSRHCSAELLVAEKLGALDTRAAEIKANRAATVDAGRSTLWADRRLAKISVDLSREMRALETLADEPDEATGYAFVVFNLEEDRNRLVKCLYREPTSLRGYWNAARRRSSARRQARRTSGELPVPPTLGASSAPPTAPPTRAIRRAPSWMLGQLATLSVAKRNSRGGAFRRRDRNFGLVARLWLRCCNLISPLSEKRDELEVRAAPEPSEVLWANLQYPEEHTQRIEMRGNIFVGALIVLSAAVLVAAKDFQLKFNNRLLEQQGGVDAGAPVTSLSALAAYSGVTTLVAGVTFVFDLVLTQVAYAIVKQERHDTMVCGPACHVTSPPTPLAAHC